MIKFNEVDGFDWDNGNRYKNLLKHNVTTLESEEVFFNRPILLIEDKKHSSAKERRYLALGMTSENRKLSISFTMRNRLIRVIPARDMDSREKKRYETHENKPKKNKPETKRDSRLQK